MAVKKPRKITELTERIINKKKPEIFSKFFLDRESKVIGQIPFAHFFPLIERLTCGLAGIFS